jgi:hypothetical protein
MVEPNEASGEMSEEEKAVVGHSLEQQIIEDGTHLMARYLRIAKNLHAVSKNDLFKQLGYDSFEQWRAQPELKLSRSTAYALIKIYDVYMAQLGVDSEKLRHMDWTKLYAASRFVNQNNVEDMLEKMRTLSRSDFNQELAALRIAEGGGSESQSQETVDVLNIIRECCPVQCGQKCQHIDNDYDVAVDSFKKFLGGWKSLGLKIKSLYGKTLSHGAVKTDAVPPQD